MSPPLNAPECRPLLSLEFHAGAAIRGAGAIGY
jgi:hypothetical protein